MLNRLRLSSWIPKPLQRPQQLLLIPRQLRQRQKPTAKLRLPVADPEVVEVEEFVEDEEAEEAEEKAVEEEAEEKEVEEEAAEAEEESEADEEVAEVATSKKRRHQKKKKND
jgi:hypothetical protein